MALLQYSLIFLLLFSSFWISHSEPSSLNQEETDKESHSEAKISTVSSLEDELSLISEGETELKISIESLLEIVKAKKLSEKQAKRLWKALYSKSKLQSLQTSIEDDAETPSHVSAPEKDKSSMGFYQLMTLMLVGYLIVMVLVKGFLTALYAHESFKILLGLLLFLSYNMILLARSLQESMEANFFSAIIYNTTFLNLLVWFHLVLVMLKFQTVIISEAELFNVDINRKGKICMTIFGVCLGYVFCFSCSSPVVQIPFYCSLLYAVNLVRMIYLAKFPIFCEPNILFSFSAFAIGLFCYLYSMGAESFHEWLFIVQKVNVFEYFFSFIGQMKLRHFVDFRFLGYLTSFGIINTLFPVYLFILNKNLWKKDGFTYESLLLKLKEEFALDKLEFDSSRYYLLIYGVIVVFSVIFTLREKLVLGTFVSLFCLVNILNMTLRNDTWVGKILSFIGGFFLLSAIHFVGLVEDQFTPTVIHFIYCRIRISLLIFDLVSC